MMPDFDGGSLDVKYTVENHDLSLSYSIDGGVSWSSCIQKKAYVSFKLSGFFGVSAGNPEIQNVNDIDVHRIDFYNMNSDYYKHDAHDVVESQEYYKRDENGYVGKTVYPWSAKLNTIELGKVAFDILELKRNNREYTKEQYMKGLNTIFAEDDISEILFKMNEQMRLINDDLMSHIILQQQKKNAVMDFESKILHEKDYKEFTGILEKEDKNLYEISNKFSELTKEAKSILDDIRGRSDERKKKFGVENDDI